MCSPSSKITLHVAHCALEDSVGVSCVGPGADKTSLFFPAWCGARYGADEGKGTSVPTWGARGTGGGAPPHPIVVVTSILFASDFPRLSLFALSVPVLLSLSPWLPLGMLGSPDFLFLVLYYFRPVFVCACQY